MAALPPVSIEEIDQLHEYFQSVQDKIPKELYLTKAEKANDTPWLINECFKFLSEDEVPVRIKHMRLDMLRRIKKALEEYMNTQ